MKKSLLIILLGIFGVSNSFGQNANPNMDVSMSSPIIALNQTTTIQAHVSNTGFNDIVANSLQLLVSVGANATIVGLDAASSANWQIISAAAGVYRLKNIATLAQNQDDAVLLTAKGIAIGGPTNINANLTYIVGVNPIIGAPSASQGNLDNTDDNAQTSLTVTNPLAVSFTNINAQKSNCDVKVGWANSTELDLAKYEVEESKDGQNFVKVGEQQPTNSRSYTSTFTLNDQIAANTIYVRIKATDKAGKFQYSGIATLNGLCGQINWKLSAYPNPATKGAFTVINAKEGVMDGTYTMQLVDITGKQVSTRIVDLDNAKTFKYQFDKALASGKYNLKITNKDGSQTTTIPLDIL